MDGEELLAKLGVAHRNFTRPVGMEESATLFSEAAEALSRQKAAGDAMAEALRRALQIGADYQDSVTVLMDPATRKVATDALTAWNSIGSDREAG